MEHSCKCCDLIFSLVQLLFAFVSTRIAKFSFSEKAVLATQSFMCLHDNIKQINFTESGLKIDSLLVASSNLKLTRATKS